MLFRSINASDLAYFEYENSGNHIKMDKSVNRNISSIDDIKQNDIKVSDLPVKDLEGNKDCLDEITENIDTEDDLTIITSPMVGTYYSSPSPESDGFVKVKDIVEEGKVLCIIEAMKLMNEIESEIKCEIRAVLVKDGDMVEYGQPLFKVKEIK